jgi:hypothetical protein
VGCSRTSVVQLNTAAHSHAVAVQESVMLDAFYAGVTSCVDPDCRKSLKVLLRLDGWQAHSGIRHMYFKVQRCADCCRSICEID